MGVLGFPNGSRKRERGDPVGGTRQHGFPQEGCFPFSWQGMTSATPEAYLREFEETDVTKNARMSRPLFGELHLEEGCFNLPFYSDWSGRRMLTESGGDL